MSSSERHSLVESQFTRGQHSLQTTRLIALADRLLSLLKPRPNREIVECGHQLEHLIQLRLQLLQLKAAIAILHTQISAFHHHPQNQIALTLDGKGSLFCRLILIDLIETVTELVVKAEAYLRRRRVIECIASHARKSIPNISFYELEIESL